MSRGGRVQKEEDRRIKDQKDFDKLVSLLRMEDHGGNQWVGDLMGDVNIRLRQDLARYGTSELLTMTDREGLTPIFVAVQHASTPDKVSLLLSIDPQIAKQTHEGRLPLHKALSTVRDAETVEMFIDAFPASARMPDTLDGILPLHAVLSSKPFPASYAKLAKKILYVYTAATKFPFKGKYPLQLCVEHGLPAQLTLDVLACNRAAATKPRDDGKLPLHLAIELGLEVAVVSALLEAHPRALLKKVPVGGDMCAVLDVAIKKRAPEAILQALIAGGGGRSPATAAYARAAAIGQFTRPPSNATGSQPPLVESSGAAGADDRTEHKSIPGAKTPRKKSICLHVTLHGGVGSQPLAVEMNPSHTVRDLKRVLFEREGTPILDQRLTFNGRQMLDLDALQTYGIQDGSVLEMTIRFEVFINALRYNASTSVCVELLRLRPISAREDDQYGVFPLQFAIQNKSSDKVIIELFNEYPRAGKQEILGGDSGEYPLHTALDMCCSMDVLTALLKGSSSADWTSNGSYNPNGKPTEALTNCFKQPLFTAIESIGTPVVVNLLLDSKCPINVRNRITDITPLGCVLQGGHTDELFTLLLQATVQAKPDIIHDASEQGRYPLHTAVGNNASPFVIMSLCELGPEVVESYDVDGRLPIHTACVRGASPAIVRVLLQCRPNTVLAVDARGLTPVLLAVTHRASPGVVMEICRTDPRCLQARGFGNKNAMELALLKEAPLWIIQELLEADPAFAEQVNLISTNFPRTRATDEIVRLAHSVQTRRYAEEVQVPAHSLKDRDQRNTVNKTSTADNGWSLASWMAPATGTDQEQTVIGSLYKNLFG